MTGALAIGTMFTKKVGGCIPEENPGEMTPKCSRGRGGVIGKHVPEQLCMCWRTMHTHKDVNRAVPSTTLLAIKASQMYRVLVKPSQTRSHG